MVTAFLERGRRRGSERQKRQMVVNDGWMDDGLNGGMTQWVDGGWRRSAE